ncbi:MAG: cyclopropane fatty acyl phospholipid synthase [Cetobacterium sp.]|uniref:cyclopropane fatty acyl phospholipid synthase n=1 Tax=Cetobacterium sp. TaxID=2071632 RepID=UPI002FC72CC0
MNSKKVIESLLDFADIKIDGKRDWDLLVNDEYFYSQVLKDGSLGLGESYMNNLWNCHHLDQLIFNILRADLKTKYDKEIVLAAVKEKLKGVFLSHTINNCKNDIHHHYDIGNDLFKGMLDKRMVYSCGYWKDVESLEEAQEQKLDLICKKIGLEPGMTLLDVGCGWGSFMKYAAEKYGAICTGVTLSKEQIKLGEELCSGLPVKFLYNDYREIKGEQFDRIVSIGMFEHVGPENYKIYMKKMNELLKDDGVFLLHTIGGLDSGKGTDPWIAKYIFPNGAIPRIKNIGEAMEDNFYMEDWHDFGPDYDKTLMEWHKRFIKNWDNIKENYDERFKRMWEYYILSCAGAFRARDLALWQIVMTKKRVDKISCRCS